MLRWSVVSVRAGVAALLGLFRVGLAVQRFSTHGYLLAPRPGYRVLGSGVQFSAGLDVFLDCGLSLERPER